MKELTLNVNLQNKKYINLLVIIIIINNNVFYESKHFLSLIHCNSIKDESTHIPVACSM